MPIMNLMSRLEPLKDTSNIQALLGMYSGITVAK